MAASPNQPQDTPPETGDVTPPTPEEAAERARSLALVKEAWQATLGTLGSADEETHALLGRLVSFGRISREEGARLFNEVRALVETRREELETQVQGAIGRAMKNFTVPTPEDVAEVAQKLAELERRVEALEDFDTLPVNPYPGARTHRQPAPMPSSTPGSKKKGRKP